MKLSQVKIIAASSIGGAFEFFDFLIFMFLSQELAQVFFSDASSIFIKKIEVFSIYALGYAVRPLAVLFYSKIGDTLGRKQVFSNTLFMMAIATLLIGILPSYNQIGIFAPILLTLLRILQGFAFSGEYPAAMVYVSEHIEAKQRGFAMGILLGVSYLGVIFAALVALILHESFSQEQMLSYGWRLPFFAGFVLCFIGIYIRRSLSETSLFQTILSQNKIEYSPFKKIFSLYPKKLFLAFCFAAFLAALANMFFIYMPIYLKQTYNYPMQKLLPLNLMATIILAVSVIIFGSLSDKIGRKRIMLYGSAIIFVGSIPLFYVLGLHAGAYLIPTCFFYSIISASCMVTSYILLAEIFPTNIRFTGYALAYNVAFALLGGTVPLISSS